MFHEDYASRVINALSNAITFVAERRHDITEQLYARLMAEIGHLSEVLEPRMRKPLKCTIPKEPGNVETIEIRLAS
ncbi:MAG: hypothetical protein KatS3mg109_0388 [Pirellulaceae bacterium]|nr:MAG: hypothetical protein KatS3mg109_0388 [Pirellulaceae bacterium]